MKVKWRKKEGEYLSHICPGCNEEHLIPMWGSSPWQFNNDLENPTLSPSIKLTLQPNKGAEVVCHYFIKNGMIEYCQDSHHDLKGQTVELPSI